jgi:DTW domain-containing protein YfiP
MDIERYRIQKQLLQLQEKKFRTLCLDCRQPDFNCYCRHIQSFDPAIKFAILMHPIEARRRIATGRMSHLCLKGSELIIGHDYSMDEQVNQLLDNPEFHPVILYPGRSSVNITHLPIEERAEIFPDGKKPLIFVVDGTWNTAKKMVRLSQNLNRLPQICFSPPGVSTFRVRKQPAPGCYSTIEAIHHTIELLGESQGFDLRTREHDKLIYAFDKLVEQQLEYVKRSVSRHRPRYPRAS